jgi:hypothetical protein
MEIKEQKQITIGKLEGDLYVAGDKVFKSFRSMVDAQAEARARAQGRRETPGQQAQVIPPRSYWGGVEAPAFSLPPLLECMFRWGWRIRKTLLRVVRS